MNAAEKNWYVNIGFGNGLVLSGNKPLPKSKLTQISCRCMVSLKSEIRKRLFDITTVDMELT